LKQMDLVFQVLYMSADVCMGFHFVFCIELKTKLGTTVPGN
jgi:hypothetical protein